MKVIAILLCSVILTFSQDNSTAQGETATPDQNQTLPVANETQTPSNATETSQPEQNVTQAPVCPTWSCETLYYAEAEYCIYQQNETSQIIVNQNYNNTNDGCYVSDIFNETYFREQGKKNRRHAVAHVHEDANLTSNSTEDHVESHLCSEQDIKLLRAKLQCSAYCKTEKLQENVTLASGLTYLQKTSSKNCSYASYKEDQLKKNKGNGTVGDLEPCNFDSECASANCQCVPVTEQSKYRGRCGIGVNHEFNQKLWNAVCQEQVLLDDVCQLVILANQSPLLVQLVENDKNKQLTCLARFADYKELPPVKLAEKKKGGVSVALIVILVIVGVAILGVTIYCCCCRKKEESEGNNNYNQMKN